VSTVPALTLHNGVVMPQLGFGVWQVPDAEAEACVGTALETGYRSIDTAAAYENEKGTGRAIAASGVPRDELFVTTKLWNSEHGRDRTLRAFEESLARLGLDHVDLYLIHWPMPEVDRYVETWRALGEILEQGGARAIGVSNFHAEHLRRLVEETGSVPVVNQVELHPYLQQADLRTFHAGHAIATEAWSPLGQGGDLLGEPVLEELARKHGRTVAQVVLRWHLQTGNVVIPKSVTPSRIAENFAVTDFELDVPDMEAIAALDRGSRLGPDPATMNWQG
jgi:diketogulonate reductase-like aldo/keto reductase